MVFAMPVAIPANRPQLLLALRDGSEALLSPITRDDRDLFIEGMDHLSIESRFTRFGQGVGRLTEAELDYLSDVDQRTHVAWGAAIDGEVAGVGRYIVLEDDDCAEIAVTVVDEYQGRGLGSLLFGALTAVARADGVTDFCFEVTVTNVPVRAMLRGLEVQLDESGSVLQGRIPIDEVPPGAHDEELVAVMDAMRGPAPPDQSADSSSRSNDSELTQ